MNKPRTTALAMLFLLAACGEQTPSPSLTSSATSASASADPAQSEAPASAAASAEAPSAFAGAWTDATSDAMAAAGAWTNKVELADLDVDGDVDILFANGGDYDAPGEPVASTAWLNNGDGTFEDATAVVLGSDQELLTRVIKVGDLNADGLPDILMGTTYNTQSRLLLGTGRGAWTDATATNLPEAELSIGDLELGDVDADGDLDVVLTDWGDAGPLGGGGRMQLWLNDGSGTFTDATADRVPETLVAFSWDIELLDVDNDWDLDLAISCKLCESSLLFVNDGTGSFADESASRMPAFTNNYEFAPIDLDGDGFLDLVTINDGPDNGSGFTEHVLRNDGTGAFIDASSEWWPADANAGWDDNVVVAIDIESDGDADFVIGSLDGPDRLLINDGSGRLSLATDVFDATPSTGTLGMAIADLNGDGRPDVVEAQGEVAEDERVYLGTEVLAPDAAPPIVRVEVVGSQVFARIHDNRSSNMPHQWNSITAIWSGGGAPVMWYGEHLFRALLPAGVTAVEVCAIDLAGNETCSGS